MNVWIIAIGIGLIAGILFGLIMNFVPFFADLGSTTRRNIVIGAIAITIITAKNYSRNKS